MKLEQTTGEVGVRAAKALTSLLGQVSSIKTRTIKLKIAGSRQPDILADIDVLGHSHRLVCKLADSGPQDVQKALKQLRSRKSTAAPDTTPVLIAPVFTAKTRALCELNHVGYLDLEGNARLVVDEVFIGKRSVRSEMALSSGDRLSA